MHPGSITNQSLPSAPEVASPNSTVFPFSLLPTELRLLIFEVFALPGVPRVYLIRPMGGLHAMLRDVLLLGDVVLGESGCSTEEFWSLRQVNREARRAVLRGRQAVYDCEIGHHHRKAAAVMFVNWNLDLALLSPTMSDGFNLNSLPTWRVNLQHFACRLHNDELDGKFSLAMSGRASPIKLVANMPSLRCVYFLVDRVPIPEYWGEYKFSIEELMFDQSGIYIFRRPGYSRPTTPTAGKAPAAHRYDFGAVPVSVETIISRYPGEPEDGFVEWCEDFVQRINRFQNNMQDLISRTCGRNIPCKTIMWCPHWAVLVTFSHKKGR
ncbi:hypothetical protein CHU98_g11647 [Xylaria longipes]|nr:hypothetical protein CHU98_g11647 [Xylaria longipes]